jgi:hypothetical protein
MAEIRKYDPEERTLRFCRRVHAIVAGGDNDERLTEAQRYAGVLKVLKCDPAILMAKVIDLCLDKRSKWNVDTYTLHRMILDLHHCITPSPDVRARRPNADENQFELDFAWQVQNGERTAMMQEAAE